MRLYFRILFVVLSALTLTAQAPVQRVLALPGYGPFLVLDDRTVALVGGTDRRSPAAFRAMMRAHPRLSLLMFLECPGTRDDASNLELGRLIRAARLDAYVPPGASVRSGAIDLLVAARHREIADGAQFMVHAWRYWDGREANEFAKNSPLHRQYLAYYGDMGMSEPQAAAFYAMTNSAPHRRARRVSAAEMRAWLPSEGAPPQVSYRSVN